MHIFKSDKGMGFLGTSLLLAVILSAVGTSLTGNFRVAIAAALAFVVIVGLRYECSERLRQHPRNLFLRAVVGVLSAALMYGIYLVFQFVHGNAELVPSLPWWLLFAFIAITTGLIPPDWRLKKSEQRQ